MLLTSKFFGVALCSAAGLLLTASGGTPPPPCNCVSLKILDAIAPPGGTIQLSVTLTEPKPIVTGSTLLTFDPALLAPAMGFALHTPSGALSDAAGAAVVRGNQLSVKCTSPSGELGTGIDPPPIITVTIGVRPDAPVGAQGILSLYPAASLWVDPNGVPYPQQVRNGIFQVGGNHSISDVSPAMGSLPAGSTVIIRGMGFQPGAIVEVDGVPVTSTVVVNSTEVDVVIGAAADLYGRRVRVQNPDLSRAWYYAYLRPAWLGQSTNTLVAATMPIFSPRTLSSASFTNAAGPGQFQALALQNPGAGPADVAVELQSSAGVVVASRAVTLPPSTAMAREVSELFAGATVPANGFLVVRSTPSVQMLGLVGDDAAGSVQPLNPALAFP
jgi:hypothetical protein